MISVLLPYRNAEKTLREAAESVLRDMGNDDELVLVDDGPSACPIALEDSRIVRIATGGIGISGALTRGLDVCRGAWIARMDADDISLPGRLPAERTLLEANPNLGAVATQIELIGDRIAGGMRRYADWQNAILSPEDHARAIFIEAPVCHPSTMIRRAALDAVGGFREGDFAEDYDLWLRLIAAGWGIAKVPHVYLRWRIHEANATKTDPRLTLEALRRLRAEHLARRIRGPRSAVSKSGQRSAISGPPVFGVWGAGPTGRRLARELEAHGLRASFFIDIDPRKIGRIARGAPILDIQAGLARARADQALLIVAVAAFGARDLVRAHLGGAGFIEGTDFVCAA